MMSLMDPERVKQARGIALELAILSASQGPYDEAERQKLVATLERQVVFPSRGFSRQQLTYLRKYKDRVEAVLSGLLAGSGQAVTILASEIELMGLDPAESIRAYLAEDASPPST